MPSHVKAALVRETARRGTSLNDVACGLVAEDLAVAYTPTGRRSPLPGASPVVLLRVPEHLKDELEAEASRSRRPINDVVVTALADGLGVPRETSTRDTTPRRSARDGARGKDTNPMAETNGSKNGARQTDKVRVAIIGVGNCANSLLQGVEYYKDAKPEDSVPGLMHVDLGGYHISDIEFVAAFDVVKGKVGEDLADAIWAHPNDTIKFSNVPKTGVKVSRGMHRRARQVPLAGRREGAGRDGRHRPGAEGDGHRRGRQLPPGRLRGGHEVVRREDPRAGVAMVNCMPVFIAREHYWQKQFEKAGVPIIGDDIESQVGATITHRVLTTLFGDRGVHLDRTMQLNVGGNSDFLNMLERERLESKKISKTNAVTSMLHSSRREERARRRPTTCRG